MHDARSTVVGLKAQECPGGGWTGMPAELEGKATVADCLMYGTCGCIYGDAAQQIEQMQAAADRAGFFFFGHADGTYTLNSK